jgi:hypothetical protein
VFRCGCGICYSFLPFFTNVHTLLYIIITYQKKITTVVAALQKSHIHTHTPSHPHSQRLSLYYLQGAYFPRLEVDSAELVVVGVTHKRALLLSLCVFLHRHAPRLVKFGRGACGCVCVCMRVGVCLSE